MAKATEKNGLTSTGEPLAGPEGGAVRVSVKDIVKRPEWQLRTSLNQARVRQYRSVYKSGAKTMPPIELADVRGTLYLVDGWRRLAAQEELGWHEVEATVKKMTASDAEWQAAAANLTHGEALKKPERRLAFNKFIKTRRHKNSNGNTMSYREMATAFGGDPSHVTVRSWIKADHPVVFKALEKNRNGEWSRDGLEAKEKQTEEQASMERFKTALALAVAESRSIGDPKARTKLDAAMTKAHESIRKHTPYRVVKVEPESDF